MQQRMTMSELMGHYFYCNKRVSILIKYERQPEKRISLNRF